MRLRTYSLIFELGFLTSELQVVAQFSSLVDTPV
jgi:hypothetical protein